MDEDLANLNRPDENPDKEIAIQLQDLKWRSNATKEDVKIMLQAQQSLVLLCQEWRNLCAYLQQASGHIPLEHEQRLEKQKDTLDQMLRQKATELLRLRLALAAKHKETLSDLNTLQSKVLQEELIRWKRRQQLAGNGAPFGSNSNGVGLESDLDTIQEWCEALAEIILQNYQQIKEVQGLCDTLKINPVGFTDTLPVLNNQVTELLSILIKRTFIIEQQPPQVIKTNSRFTSTVRVLVGGQSNLHMTLPQVSVSIISGAQANDLMKNDTITDRESSGEILNNVGTMEWNKRTRQLSVSFKNMQLKKIKRAGKKGNASVKNEKHSLLFQYEFKVDELSFQVWTLSLPVVVIVHGNQESGSWGTISWDNAFAELGRVQFEIPEKVPWCKVADMLVCKFSALNGRGLSEENLRYLAGKAFRNDQVEEYGSMMLSWPQFCKDPLPGCSFTFWEWVYENMKLLSEDLRALWNGGCILGYVGRNQTEEMLLSRTNYTFLLRFSESELGGITITWVAEAKESGKREVFRIQPFTNKDLVIRSLADRINDLKWLLYLYPEVPKDQAFRKYYTPMTCNISKSGNGYINSALVTHVPGFGPTTEQHISKLTQLDLEDVQSSDLERTMDFSELTNFNLGNILSIDLYTPMDFSSTRITLK